MKKLFHRRTRLHFDGDPFTFRQMQRLFRWTSRLQVKYEKPEPKKFRLGRIDLAVDQWKKRHAA